MDLAGTIFDPAWKTVYLTFTEMEMLSMMMVIVLCGELGVSERLAVVITINMETITIAYMIVGK
jgi:hypothetical protein